jgi:hypothetical protein
VDEREASSQGLHGQGGTSVVLLMVRDAYANYVVQTTLDVLPDNDGRRCLLAELNDHCDELVRLVQSLNVGVTLRGSNFVSDWFCLR